MQSGEVYLHPTSLYELVYVLRNPVVQDGRNAWTCRRYKNFTVGSHEFVPDRGRLGSSIDPSAYYIEEGIVFEDTINNLCTLSLGLELRED